MKKKIIISSIIVFLILIIGVSIIILNKPEKEIQKETQGEISKINEYSFSLKINNIKDNEISYKLNDNYTIKLVLKEDNNAYNYDIYVNEKFILNDFNTDENVKFYILGDNLIYINTGYTDIRSEHIYIIDTESNIKEIYELDDIKGMVPYEIQINENSIVIKASRLSHGPSIIYDKAETMDAMLDDNDTWDKYNITKKTIIEATYTYNVVDNKLNLEPTITDEISIKEYLKREE